jgi:hypothetical protein
VQAVVSINGMADFWCAAQARIAEAVLGALRKEI